VLLLQPAHAAELLAQGLVSSEGDVSVLATLASVMDTFNTDFNISTP
jgi:alkyl sulfatase BDS1-like metallo-beta-lactamase superfamily hydrolase